MRKSTPVGMPLLLAALLAVPTASFGQSPVRSMTWTEVNELDAHGFISQIARLFGMDGPVVREMELHVQGEGSVLIQGDGDGVSVIDLDRGELLMIDHLRQSVLRADLTALSELTAEMVDGLRTGLEADPMTAELQAMQGAGGGMSIDFTVTTHANARSESIGQYPVDVHYVVVEADMDAPPAGTDPAGEPATLYLVNEIWETHAVPSEAEFLEELGMNIASDPRLMELANATGGSEPEAAFAMLDAWTPGLGDAMREMTEQAEQFTGTILRSVTAVSLTPYGTEVALPDLAAMIAADPEASSATSAIQGALGGLGGLGGLFGGSGPQAPSSNDPAPPYTPYLRMLSTRENLRHWEWEGDVLEQLTESIQGYRVQSLEELMRGVMP